MSGNLKSYDGFFWANIAWNQFLRVVHQSSVMVQTVKGTWAWISPTNTGALYGASHLIHAITKIAYAIALATKWPLETSLDPHGQAQDQGNEHRSTTLANRKGCDTMPNPRNVPRWCEVKISWVNECGISRVNKMTTCQLPDCEGTLFDGPSD